MKITCDFFFLQIKGQTSIETEIHIYVFELMKIFSIVKIIQLQSFIFSLINYS